MIRGKNLESSRAARLLLTERDALLPILHRTPEDAFDRPTICTGWSVRDVLAHCSAALTRVATGNLHRFTPEDNEADVEMRRSWPLADVLAELERGYSGAAHAIADAGGLLDGVALGEWIHGGDVREPLGEPNAYCSEGIDDALALLSERSRLSNRVIPYTRVDLGDRQLTLSRAPDGAEMAEMTTAAETLIRLCSGRKPDLARLRVTGANPSDYLLFS